MNFDINIVSASTILAPLVTGAIFYRKLPPFARFLFLFVVVTFLLEIVTRIYCELGWNNMFLFHLYSYVEVGFICLIYYALSDRPLWKRAIQTVFGLFVTVSLLNLLFFDELTHFNSMQRYVEMVIVYTLLSAYLLNAVYDPKNRPLAEHPAILLTMGYMIYFLGTLFLFVYGEEILSGNDGKYWVIHGIFNILLNGMYAFVFWKAVKWKKGIEVNKV